MIGAEISCCRCGVLLMERRAGFRSSRTRELREAKQSFFRRSQFLTSQAIRLRHCSRSRCISRTIMLAMQVECKLLPDRFSVRHDCGLE